MTTSTLSPEPLQVSVFYRSDALRTAVSIGWEMLEPVPTRFDLAGLAALSVAAARASSSARDRAKASQALYESLYPGIVGQTLRESPPCRLTLQLPPELDALAWEQAGETAETIGQKFNVSRQLTWPDRKHASAAGQAPPLDSALRVALVEGRPWTPGAAECVGTPKPGETPDKHTIAPGCHLVRVVGGSLAVALARNTLPARRCLIVGEAGSGAERIDAVREVLRQGHLLLDFGPVRTMAAQDDLFKALGEQLEAGRTVSEAVRRMRDLPWTGRRGARSLILYGAADLAFIRPSHGGLTVRERRQVTSLSFDIVNSTGVLEEIGGQRYGPLNAQLQLRCREIVSLHQGRPREAQGNDGCMNYFGPSEDAANQAVMAAREIAALDIDDRIRVRVGVATGEVAVQWDYFYGLSIHLAAHLQSRAMPGTVLVSQSTHALTDHRFDLQPLLQKLRLKNIRAAQQAWLVLGLRRQATRELAGLSPFVGRDAELGALATLWEAVEGGQARSALVTGDAGIGKSRLLLEFRKQLQARGGAVLQLHCTREGGASAFHPLVDALRNAFDLRADDNADVASAKLALHGTASDNAVLAKLLGVPHPWPVELADATPERIRLRTLEALVRWFAASSHERPLCLLVEDIHWIDRSTVEFLESLLSGAQPMPLLTVLARRKGTPEGMAADEACDWQPAAVSLRIELQALSPTAAFALVGGLCRTRVNAASVRLLVQRGDGVPLFLEESARMVLAMRSPSARALREQVPMSLKGLLTEQLDALGPARIVMLLGSVLGREFSVALLHAVVELGGFDVLARELDAWLATAERSGLLRARGEGDQRRYVFKHALVRDEARSLLWDEDRVAVHRAVVKALRGPARELAARQPELLAVHLAGAGRKSLAFAQWQDAARSASSRYAKHEQASHLRSALELLDGRLVRRRDAREQQELELQLRLASCYFVTEGYGADLVKETYEKAERLSRRRGDDQALLTSQLGLEGCHFMRADFSKATEFAQRAQAMAMHANEQHQRLQAQWAIANIRFHQGDGVEAVRLMDECHADYESYSREGACADQSVVKRRRYSVQDPGVMCLCYSGWGQWELGYPDDALRRVRDAFALAIKLDHPFSIAEAMAFAINVHHYRGETAEALDCAQRCVKFCGEHRFPVWMAHALVMRGRLLCETGSVEEGLDDMAAGNDMWERTKAIVTRPLYLAMHAEGWAIQGQPERGLGLLEQAMQLVQGNGERYYEAELHRLTARLTLASADKFSGVEEDAERSLLAALALAHAQHKRGFELRSGIDLARLWSGRGEHERAHCLLKPLLDGWTEGLLTRDLRLAREVLQGLRPEHLRERERTQCPEMLI